MSLRLPHYPPLCFAFAVFRALLVGYAFGVMVFLAVHLEVVRAVAIFLGLLMFVETTGVIRDLPGHWRRLQRWREGRP